MGFIDISGIWYGSIYIRGRFTGLRKKWLAKKINKWSDGNLKCFSVNIKPWGLQIELIRWRYDRRTMMIKSFKELNALIRPRYEVRDLTPYKELSSIYSGEYK